MKLHPSDRSLNRFADGELSGWRRASISRHLQRCTACRNTVMVIRGLGREAQGLEVAPLPGELRARVLAAAKRAPSIVPVADPTRRGWAWQRLAWVGGGAVLAAVVIRMVVAPAEVRSEASLLEFAPERPEPGAHITVTYEATSRFAGHTELKLRAVLHRVSDGPSVSSIAPVVVATLTRERDGIFRGAFDLPPDVVYGTFAVEDIEGRTVDRHGTMGWELLTSQEGLPSRDALLQSAYEAAGRDLGLALEHAARATDLYPDLVAAWALRNELEQRALGSAVHDSLRVVHIDRLEALHRLLRDAPVRAEVAIDMFFFATSVAAQEIADWWQKRLLQDWPKSVPAGQLRAVAIIRNGDSDPDSALGALEHLWSHDGARHSAIAQTVFAFALAHGNDAAAMHWARRRIGIEPSSRLFLVGEMLGIPSLRDTVLAWLHTELAALAHQDDGRRPLFRSVEQQQEWDEQRRCAVLGLMGRAKRASGDTDEARALLDSATAEGWNLELIEAAAGARLEAGDIPRAVAMLGRLAADPAYVGGDLTERALRLVPPDEWATHVERGRDHMIATTLAQARARIMPRPTRVTDDTGAERDLGDVLGGHVSVIAFYWPGCQSCVAELRELQELQQRVPAKFRVVLVTSRRMRPSEFGWLKEAGVESPVVVDLHGDVADALEPWGRPFYVMVDPSGIVRFVDTNPQDIPRQALALAVSEPLVS